MYKRFAALLALLTVLALALPVAAEPQPASMPFDINARSALLMEYTTGQTLYQKNPDLRVPIASVTKIMTLCLIFNEVEQGALNYSDKIQISHNAAKIGGSNALTDEGELYRADELIKTIIIASANDACIALAEHLAGSEDVFVQRMNEKAAVLGMKNTSFKNCTGMPASEHYSSAADVAIMSRELLRHKDFFRWSRIWMDTIKHKNERETELTNTNRLVRFYQGCDGLKTGSTDEAKYCLSATALRDGTRYIAIILGAPNSDTRFEETKKLLNYGFANYSGVMLAQAGEEFGNIPVKGGKADSVQSVLPSNLALLMQKGTNKGLERKVELANFLQAPIKKGQRVGMLSILRNGKLIAKADIVAAVEVPVAGYKDYLHEVIQQWNLAR